MEDNKNPDNNYRFTEDDLPEPQTSDAAIFPSPVVDDSFDPYSSIADRWLYEEAEGDSDLLFGLLALERQHELKVGGEFPSDQAERIERLRDHIQQRRELMDEEPDEPMHL